MEIKLTIGVTPALENALLGLSALVSISQPQQQVAPAQAYVAPVETVQQAPIPVAPQQAVPVTHQPVAPVVPIQQQHPEAPVTPAPLPTAASSYSMDQLAVAATQLMDAGKRNELLQLLASFGVNALTELPKEQYGNFATQLRGLGAKI